MPKISKNKNLTASNIIIPEPNVKMFPHGKEYRWTILLLGDAPTESPTGAKAMLHVVEIKITETNDKQGKNADINMSISHDGKQSTQSFDVKNTRTVNDKKLRNPMASLTTIRNIFKYRKKIMIDYLKASNPHSLVSQTFKRERSRMKLYDRHFREIGKETNFIYQKFNPGDHESFFYYFLFKPQNTIEQNKKSMLYWLSTDYVDKNVHRVK